MVGLPVTRKVMTVQFAVEIVNSRGSGIAESATVCDKGSLTQTYTECDRQTRVKATLCKGLVKTSAQSGLDSVAVQWA